MSARRTTPYRLRSQSARERLEAEEMGGAESVATQDAELGLVESRYSAHDDAIYPDVPRQGRRQETEDGVAVSWRDEKGNLALLVLLYLLQGVPIGLVMGTLPILLQPHVSMADMAVFSLAGYPYSLKLLWSPIVDSVYSPWLGRRKSWIVPVQIVLAGAFFLLGHNIDALMDAESTNVTLMAIIFFMCIVCAATQDIAVDGLALEILSPRNRTYASTCQSIGLNTGYFLAFTVFLAFNSPEFCNHYVFSEPQSKGLLQLGPFFMFWAALFVVSTVILLIFNRESVIEESERLSMRTVYGQMWSVIQLPHMRSLIVLLLVAKVGFMAHEAVTGLKLLERGIDKKDLGLVAIIDFPFQIVLGISVAKWASGGRAMKPYLYGAYGRMVMCVVGLVLVAVFPENYSPAVHGDGYYYALVATFLLTSMTATAMFVATGAFFARISDPSIGGTYLTLLNTLSNFGGTWPKYFVFLAVDYATVSECIPSPSGVDVDSASLASITCANAAEKAQCVAAHGVCSIVRDGYYPVAIGCLALGVAIYALYVHRTARRIEKHPDAYWRVPEAKTL